MTYSLGELLTGNPKYKFDGEMYEDLKKSSNPEKSRIYSIIFYLAPGDYHRFHSPTRLNLKSRNHILGHLAPVKISYISSHPVLY
jgi:phosphatidylserine decarboxylase